VHRCCLERLFSRQRRQDGRECPRQHRLAYAGRSAQKDVVSARRGDLGGSRPSWPWRLVDRPQLDIAAQETQHISQAARAEDPQVPCGLSLPQVTHWNDQPLQSFRAAEAKCDRK
jgi:hypothetical protein